MKTKNTGYMNAMEPLAIAEIERQMQTMSPSVTQSINKDDAIAYALNRLPPLYATTEEGWNWQQERARETLQHLICKAASWGLRAAQRRRKGFSTWWQAKSPVKEEKVDEKVLSNEFEPASELKDIRNLRAG